MREKLVPQVLERNHFAGTGRNLPFLWSFFFWIYFVPATSLHAGKLRPKGIYFLVPPGMLAFSKVPSKKESLFRQLWSAKIDQNSRRFNTYYSPCHKRLTMYCLGLLKDIELAENVASETLIKLLEAPDPQSIQNVENWLFAIAKNRCLSLLSQTKRRREILDQVSPTIKRHTFASGEQKLFTEDMDRMITAHLNEKELSIWKLHMEGYDNREIARQLKMNKKTVANLKSIARNKLQKALAPE